MTMTDKPSQQSKSEQRSMLDDHENESFSPLAKRFLWADSSSAVERVIFWLSVLCVLLFVADFIYHRHSYAPGEGTPGFYAFVGFIAFTVIVLGATQLRRVILRNENYYAPYSVDAEEYPEHGLEMLVHGEEGVAEAGDSSSDSDAFSDSDVMSDSDAYHDLEASTDAGDDLSGPEGKSS